MTTKNDQEKFTNLTSKNDQREYIIRRRKQLITVAMEKRKKGQQLWRKQKQLWGGKIAASTL